MSGVYVATHDAGEFFYIGMVYTFYRILPIKITFQYFYNIYMKGLYEDLFYFIDLVHSVFYHFSKGKNSPYYNLPKT